MIHTVTGRQITFITCNLSVSSKSTSISLTPGEEVKSEAKRDQGQVEDVHAGQGKGEEECVAEEEEEEEEEEEGEGGGGEQQSLRLSDIQEQLEE